AYFVGRGTGHDLFYLVAVVPRGFRCPHRRRRRLVGFHAPVRVALFGLCYHWLWLPPSSLLTHIRRGGARESHPHPSISPARAGVYVHNAELWRAPLVQ